MGGSIRSLRVTIQDQNNGIESMAQEAQRLRGKAAELKEVADRARAQRASALRRLGDLAVAPGVKKDCEALVKDAEDALDIAIEEGV